MSDPDERPPEPSEHLITGLLAMLTRDFDTSATYPESRTTPLDKSPILIMRPKLCRLRTGSQGHGR